MSHYFVVRVHKISIYTDQLLTDRYITNLPYKPYYHIVPIFYCGSTESLYKWNIVVQYIIPVQIQYYPLQLLVV